MLPARVSRRLPRFCPALWSSSQAENPSPAWPSSMTSGTARKVAASRFTTVRLATTAPPDLRSSIIRPAANSSEIAARAAVSQAR